MTAAGRARQALLLALASLALLKLGASMLCPAGRCRAPDFDVAILLAVHDWRTPLLDSLFAGLTWAGSLYVLLPLALLLAIVDTRSRGPWQRGFVLLALASQWPVVHIAKLAISRPRPALFEPLIALPLDASFPSAHAAQITAFACAWLLRPGHQAQPLPVVMLGASVVMVALSRLYLQVHYPSDVLFAIAMTVPWVLALRVACDALGKTP